MIETVFLAVLVLALFLGNVFLSATDPKRVQRMIKESQRAAQSSENGSEQTQNNLPENQGDSFEDAAGKERINYLNKRIARLEQLLLKINKSNFIAQKLNGTNLAQKISDLDEFKQNTRLEIAALKQRLDRIQPSKKAPKQDAPEISDEKLRDIVFRASN